jgi:hypothetical protein
MDEDKLQYVKEEEIAEKIERRGRVAKMSEGRERRNYQEEEERVGK